MSTQDNGADSENQKNPGTQDNSDGVNNPSKDSQDNEQAEISRRKAKALEQEVLMKRNQEMAERLKKLESKVFESEEKEMIQATLKTLGVSTYDKKVFDETKNALLDKFPLDRAIKYALQEASQQAILDKMDEDQREQGRENAAIPPRGSSAIPEPKDEFPLLSKEAFGSLMKNKCKELGDKKGIAYYEAYCAHQEGKGRKYFKE